MSAIFQLFWGTGFLALIAPADPDPECHIRPKKTTQATRTRVVSEALRDIRVKTNVSLEKLSVCLSAASRARRLQTGLNKSSDKLMTRQQWPSLEFHS